MRSVRGPKQLRIAVANGLALVTFRETSIDNCEKEFIVALKQHIRLDPIVDVIAGLVTLLNGSKQEVPAEVTLWCDQMLEYACRKMEIFVDPEVSVEAKAEATRRGVKGESLRTVSYKDQPTRLKDKGREVFHWEHVMPVSQMKKRLLDGQTPCTSTHVLSVIRQIDIAWILKSENVLLHKKGYRSERPADPWDAYRESNIKMERRCPVGS